MYANSHYPVKEFKINDFIVLRQEGDRTNIYVKNRIFTQCMYLLLNIPVDKVKKYDDIDSIDEAAEILDRSMEGGGRGVFHLDPEEEFMGHCSNMQAWAENDYDTRILHRNLAFPLLKKLSDAGDPLAKNRIKEEIALRYASGHETVMTFLADNGYLKYLSRDELEYLLDDNKLPIISTLARISNDITMVLETDSVNDRLMRLIREASRNIGYHNIPFIISHLNKDFSDKSQEVLVKFIYSNFRKHKDFPLMEFLNNYIEFFKELDLNSIMYDEKIIGFLGGTILNLRDKGVKNVEAINLPEDEYLKIEEIDLSNNLINDLNGIQKFRNVQRLKLNNNKIYNINALNNLKLLQDLSLRNNIISKIENKILLPKLESLDLSGNLELAEIPEWLNCLPALKSVNFMNCSIKKFSESTSTYFWMKQNYRFYSNFTLEDIEYYESQYNKKSKSGNQCYKHFVIWILKMKEHMKYHKFTYEDLHKFEAVSKKKGIWSGRLTNDFLKWLDNKKQIKITDFL
ncbi:MAG: leucine-rich repeat domain-containing protein [Candidatus Lokiarchaeota archaeon]|nr:leucine-rich repeat domain-containing protein [Candidatus Lokiarchaeota archaeon]